MDADYVGNQGQGESNFQKGTFIDVEDADIDPGSDPGSASSDYSPVFVAHRASVSSLILKIAKWSSLSDFGSDYSETPINGRTHTRRCSPNCKCSTSVASTSASPGFDYTKTVDKSSGLSWLQLHRDELKVRMRRNAEMGQQMVGELTPIQEIPEQVNEVFQQIATHLVDEVTSAVSEARQLLAATVKDPETSAKLATQVEEILEMVMASFETSFANAMNHVRVWVKDAVQMLENCTKQQEEVVQHLWSIPEEVRQITRDVVKKAPTASLDKVVLRRDRVLQNRSAEEKTDVVFRAKQKIVHSLPQTLPETVRRSCDIAKYNVQNTTQVGVEKGMGAKAVDPSIPALPEKALTNPGSRGHPEFCSRACLYYPMGKCTNGLNCKFCHMPHSKRIVHLDKRLREMMRNMDFVERAYLILPILKTKLDALDACDVEVDVKEGLAKIAKTFHHASMDKNRTNEARTLHSSLKSMSARYLLSLLYHSQMHTLTPKDTLLYEAIREYFQMSSQDSASQVTGSQVTDAHCRRFVRCG